MDSLDTFNTIADLVQAELKVKGSRFIARAKPVGAKDKAEQFIEEIRKQHHDATHNCFAYRIGVGMQEVSRSSDDGEPSGTAGKPILQAVVTRDLTNVIVVVTRYFGGTKLGTGGLIRAYGAAAIAALDIAEIKPGCLTDTVDIEYSYEMSGIVQRAIELFAGQIMASRYETDVRLKVAVPKSQVTDFIRHLTEMSSGKITTHS
jgi:uncharacterized YigZ family protein